MLYQLNMVACKYLLLYYIIIIEDCKLIELLIFRPFHVYRDSLMYRSSHYFVMFFTEIMLITGGLPYTKTVDIMHIELPRSMADVVINWNIPMHKWLKYRM